MRRTMIRIPKRYRDTRGINPGDSKRMTFAPQRREAERG
jgi:bifunctional DNA-binding transcriptional regulator/antitoxin component of YhaV-PrlF toxin-antitoxin module